MTGPCLTCGVHEQLHAHHVAGQHNHATLTVAVCAGCHRILTSWQLASGVELDASAPRTDLDAQRALLVGAAQLIQLYAQRHPEQSAVSSPLAILTVRAASKILDASGAPDRPGRWLPDPTVSPMEAVPVPWPSETGTARFTEWAHLLREVTRLLGDPTSVPAETWAALAAKPEELDAALRAREPVLTEALTQLVDHIARSEEMILRLLVVDDVTRLDEQLLEEAAVWIATGNRLLHRAVTIAVTGTEVLR